ncbi:DNA-directed RNA polymerase subunit beta' [Candidatus Parcubacteria bacterium]|nr:MAG: DNA-directed RNA polymerase subunit beta' [Candidatus Parcubacteria bacterium]
MSGISTNTTRLNDFKAIRLRLASSDEILKWSYGEVVKPETINYRTQRAEKDGLFSEAIFGPTKDWECYCGKYRRIRYKGVVCDRCGVEVTRASVRRERFGHIQLATPVTHIWFLKGIPSKLGLLLDIPVLSLEKVVYFAAYIITEVDETALTKASEELGKEYKSKTKGSSEKTQKPKIKEQYDEAKDQLSKIKILTVLSENDYRDLSLRYGEVFKAGTGAEAIHKIVKNLDLHKLEKELVEEAKSANIIAKKKILKRLKLVQGMIRAGLRPEWMFVTILPVIPPDLRPMVQLDGGRYASSDLNDLYRRVINRNNRLKKLLDLNAPEVIVRNEKRMLQEALDALLDNSARKEQALTAPTAGQRRLLKSLADMLKGKQGRFRQNLLGKRVDYSARSVIVVGPELRLDECGMPKRMALELFKPFVIHKLVERDIAHNIRGASRLIDEMPDEVWAILEEVIQDKHVLLNRAPTLHRLGIQAFKPKLIEGMAIQIHPLVCAAFNADFDGDQMAAHLPLSEEAQVEAKELVLSTNNILKPATGDPIAVPRQDMVMGCFWLTKLNPKARGGGLSFGSKNEAVLAYQVGHISLNAPIKVLKSQEERAENLGEERFLETTVGRILFNAVLPQDFPFANREFTSKGLERLAAELVERYGINEAGNVLDKIKNLGFEYATKSGISWGMDDLKVPAKKQDIIDQAEKEVELITEQYSQGLLTNDERYSRVVGIWTKASAKIASLVGEVIDPLGPISFMVDSGARGSKAQLNQMTAIKGLVVNPSGETIELPVKSSYKEGLDVLEYFISTHGARKGTADTALKTSAAGYLTRRMIDVAQDVVVHEEDCGEKEGTPLYREDAKELNISFAAKIFGRVAAADIIFKKSDGSSEVLVKSGEVIDRIKAELVDKHDSVTQVQVFSALSCKSIFGVCQKCYGYDLGYNSMVKLGAAVGIVAAQAIGEPGTQLTMRTFHVGGVAGASDITLGLPRVEEVLEARIPKNKAALAPIDGKITSIELKGNEISIKISPKEKQSKGDETVEVIAPKYLSQIVQEGQEVQKGDKLTEGSIDLQEMFKVGGLRPTERSIIFGVQQVYSYNGAGINDKHIEVIVRQMFSRVKITDPGDTLFSPGEVVEKSVFRDANREIKAKGGRSAKAQQLLLGITKVALSAESFLAAASFQETTRVLINAAVSGKIDKLRGLKENVIIGRLIPAGTGFKDSRLENF